MKNFTWNATFYSEENWGSLKVLIRKADEKSTCFDLSVFPGFLKSYSLNYPLLQKITTVPDVLFTCQILFYSDSRPSLCCMYPMFFLTL